LAKLARNQAGSAVAREAVHQEFPGLDHETVAELLVDYNVIAQVRHRLTHSFIRDDSWNGRIGTEPHPLESSGSGLAGRKKPPRQSSVRRGVLEPAVDSRVC
jgi:hypothetical protein